MCIGLYIFLSVDHFEWGLIYDIDQQRVHILSVPPIYMSCIRSRDDTDWCTGMQGIYAQ